MKTFHDNNQYNQTNSSWLNSFPCLKWKLPCHQAQVHGSIPETGIYLAIVCWLVDQVIEWLEVKLDPCLIYCDSSL